MVAGIPAREIDVILTELSVLLDSDQTDTMQLRRHEASLKKLWAAQAIPADEYYVTKSFIEFGKYQRDASVAAALNARKLAPLDKVTLCNVLSILVAAVEVDEAISLIKQMSANHNGDIEIIRTLIIKSADLLQYEHVYQLFEILDAISLNLAPNVYLRRPSTKRSYEAMKTFGLIDSSAANLLKEALKALKQENHDVWRTSRSILRDGSILFFLHIRADADQCAMLNFSIADRLVEKFENPAAEFISFLCRPLADVSEIRGLPGDCV